MTMLGLDKASCCGVLCLFLALAMVFLRAQPKHPATIDEIVSDGGKYVLTTDGRLIEYFTCGKMDDGIPLYFQHGYGNTGKLVFAVPEFCAAAKKLGLKIISPSQPGFGLSSTYPLSKKRTLAEWPADIDLILKQEKVDKFYVSGWSAGCIHALTVANAFSDRTLGIGIGTPTTPLEIEEQENGNMALPTKFVRKTFVIPFVGDLLGFLMSLMDGRGRMAAAPDVAAALDKMEGLANKGNEKWRTILNNYCRDQDRGMIKGYRGWADNMDILNENLPFDLKELGSKMKGKKIIISTAKDDTTNPPCMQEWYIKHLPGSELMHCREGWAHLHPVEPGYTLELWRRMMGKKAIDDWYTEPMEL